jgi:hypothetical protein
MAKIEKFGRRRGVAVGQIQGECALPLEAVMKKPN